jgi:hypothetical protein
MGIDILRLSPQSAHTLATIIAAFDRCPAAAKLVQADDPRLGAGMRHWSTATGSAMPASSNATRRSPAATLEQT